MAIKLILGISHFVPNPWWFQNNIVFLHMYCSKKTFIMGEKINFEELRKQMPKKLNKAGEWFFSKNRTMFLEVNDLKAVLK